MSWAVYCDNSLLYDARVPDYKLPTLKLTQELNKADSLTFSIYPNHPAFAAIKKFEPTIVVIRDGVVKAKLRILDEKIGWENGKTVVAEGPLAWLNDSIQRPFSFPTETSGSSPRDYLSFLISRHNEQVSADRQFAVGTVTVTDPNGYIARSDTEYSTTWELVKEGLIDSLGGYIIPRYESDGIYLDYFDDSSMLANQPITFGINLLSIETERRGADIATAILPLGKVDGTTNERLTIEDLPDSTTSDICKSGDIVYSASAESAYGSRITKAVVWDSVTVADNLLAKAIAELAVARQMRSTVEMSAADLSAAGYNYNTFSLGTYVQIFDEWHEQEHGLSAMYLVKKLSIDILRPEDNKLVLGATTLSFTEASKSNIEGAIRVVENNITRETASAISELEQRNMSAIEQSERSIMLSVSENYYTKDEADGIVSALSTTINQTADGIRIDFSSLQQDVADVQASADARFESLQSYIQMAGGNITLGEIGNEITLKVENDRISILRNGVAITYWTADDFVSPISLTIPVGGRLNLGNYAYIPRTNGSLDFVWVGA